MTDKRSVTQEALDAQGIPLFAADIVSHLEGKGKYFESVKRLCSLVQSRPKNVMIELKQYREIAPVLIELIHMLYRMHKASMQQVSRYENVKAEKSGKRWTKEEDDLLVEIVCDREDKTELELSNLFGRSPSAIKTRLSYLVGVKRIKQEIAGRFIGKIDGETQETFIDGTLYKD